MPKKGQKDPIILFKKDREREPSPNIEMIALSAQEMKIKLLIRSIQLKRMENGLYGLSQTPAGFDIGTGIYINTTLPEEGAEYLREVKVK